MWKSRIQLLTLIVGAVGTSTSRGAPNPTPNKPNHEHHGGAAPVASFFSAARQFVEHRFNEWGVHRDHMGKPSTAVQPSTHHPAATNTASQGPPAPNKQTATTFSAASTKMVNTPGKGGVLANSTGSKQPASGFSSTNHGAVSSSSGGSDHIERALHHLSEARQALRAGHDESAHREVHESMRQVEEAIGARTGHSGNGGAISTVGAASSSSRLSTVATSTSSGPSAGVGMGAVRHPHLHDALKHLRAAERQINERHAGKAELDIHDAFVQLTEANSGG